LNIDRDLSAQVTEAARRLGEKESTVYRLALRAGLPLIATRFPTSPDPEPSARPDPAVLLRRVDALAKKFTVRISKEEHQALVKEGRA
jgi:hypothetical protein